MHCTLGALDSLKEAGRLPMDTSGWRRTFPALGFAEGPGLGGCGW